AYSRNLHPGVDVLPSRLSADNHRLASLLVHVTSMALALVMILSGLQFAWFVRLQISPALAIPKWIIMAVIPASGLVLLFHGLVFFLKTLQQVRR
ncbi:MAG: TRAP transporter small permease, partial [Desulfobulbaceae bacterium]|nr:TRAP transporter small permease [Desulfobulbaceae bacterium]